METTELKIKIIHSSSYQYLSIKYKVYANMFADNRKSFFGGARGATQERSKSTDNRKSFFGKNSSLHIHRFSGKIPGFLPDFRFVVGILDLAPKNQRLFPKKKVTGVAETIFYFFRFLLSADL